MLRARIRGPPAHEAAAALSENDRPSASELLATPGALLSRGHLRELGLERRAIDAVFRECPVVQLPGYSRPMVRVADYLALLDGSMVCDRCGDRVRP